LKKQGQYQLQVRLTTPEDLELAEVGRLKQKVAQLIQQRKYQEAIPLAEKMLQMCQRILGQDDPDVASSLDDLYRFTGFNQQPWLKAWQ
jgi:Tetratricopeptide repeat